MIDFLCFYIWFTLFFYLGASLEDESIKWYEIVFSSLFFPMFLGKWFVTIYHKK